jgi:hypothetical protein
LRSTELKSCSLWIVERGVVLFNNGFVLLMLLFMLEERGVFRVELRDVPPLPVEARVPFIGVVEAQ